jgi:hypothetical protein
MKDECMNKKGMNVLASVSECRSHVLISFCFLKEEGGEEFFFFWFWWREVGPSAYRHLSLVTSR